MPGVVLPQPAWKSAAGAVGRDPIICMAMRPSGGLSHHGSSTVLPSLLTDSTAAYTGPSDARFRASRRLTGIPAIPKPAFSTLGVG